MSYSTEHIRNAALAGHPGAGKTTLFEALLHAGGAIQTAGTIERGSTVSDFDGIEKERGHSIDPAIASIDHDVPGQSPIHVNLIDRPVIRISAARRCRRWRLKPMKPWCAASPTCICASICSG